MLKTVNSDVANVTDAHSLEADKLDIFLINLHCGNTDRS